MRVGIAILPEHRWPEARRRWTQAEHYGFDHAWTYDHLGWRTLVDGPWFGAVPTLSAAAVVTSTIGLGFFVASPASRHPVSFARDITSIDELSGGRLLVGIGAGGGGGYDATVLGDEPIQPAARMQRFREFVELLDLVLTNERTTYSGSHFSAVEARGAPGCVQRPRAPFVIAANGPKAMALAAQHGDGWATTGPDDATTADDWWSGTAALAQRFDDALAASGRPDAGDVRRYLNLDSNVQYSMSGVEIFVDAIGRAEAIGFTDVVTTWPRPDGVYAGSESVLEAVAADVLPGLRTT